MKFLKNIYQQLDGISVEKIESALLKDGCIKENMTFYHPSKDYRLTLHFHPKKTFSAEMVVDYFLARTKWDIDDLKRLKLIKKK